jgi:cyclin E
MDLKYHKPPEIFNTHPVLSPQMRAILIDWMMDVCEAYKMHRETLYLAIDYLDRYLAAQKNIAKTVLQLIGEGINRTVTSISFQTKLVASGLTELT